MPVAASLNGIAIVRTASPSVRDPPASGRARNPRSPSAVTAPIGCCSTPLQTCVSRSPQTRELHANPKLGLRHSPIKAVVLTNGDVDHVIGLINLREAQPFTIYGTTPRARHREVQHGVPGAGRGARAARRAPARQARRDQGRRRRSGPYGRSLCRAGQGCAVPRGCLGGRRFRHAGGRHHRPQGYRSGNKDVVFLRSGLRDGRRHAHAAA